MEMEMEMEMGHTLGPHTGATWAWTCNHVASRGGARALISISPMPADGPPLSPYVSSKSLSLALIVSIRGLPLLPVTWGSHGGHMGGHMGGMGVTWSSLLGGVR
eukprot:7383592-Prymnesium_polylepis.1